MMIILTGGAGFIGSAFLSKLNAEGITDVIVVDYLDETEKWKNLVGKQFSDYYQKDDFIQLVKDNKIPVPRHIIHMGACSSTTCIDAGYFIKNNYEYSKTLAEWAISNKVPFLYASSAATYGIGDKGYSDRDEDMVDLQPLNMYGYSKHLFDLWLLKNKLINKVTGIKFFNVFGPNEYHKGEMMSIVCKKLKEITEDGCIKLFRSHNKKYQDGEQKRDFVYIKDVVEVMYYLMENFRETGIYNLGTGKAQGWNDLADAMFAALGKNAKIKYIDMPEQLKEKYQYFTQADLGKLREAGCNHEFMPLQESVKDYVVNYLVEGKRM
jgi:ADP-L-glycero-D-manno-heptose 6-epimerase